MLTGLSRICDVYGSSSIHMIPGLDSTLSNIGPQSGLILDKVESQKQQGIGTSPVTVRGLPAACRSFSISGKTITVCKSHKSRTRLSPAFVVLQTREGNC
jgi:hypothetical protein